MKRISEIAKVLIDDELDYLKLSNSLKDYKNLLFEISEIQLNHEEHRNNIYLDSGKAIATEWAIRCIDDIMRTKQFVKGVFEAVKDVQQIKGNDPVYILYAGTGPFATLALPLISLFDHTEIQFVFLEINPVSMAAVKKTINELEADTYIHSFHECDATKFDIPSDIEIDIVLTECLQCALAKEPQVSITFNLIKQLKKDVILIPEDISLYIGLSDTTKINHMSGSDSSEEINSHYTNSPAVYSLNKELVWNYRTNGPENGLSFEPVEVDFESIGRDHFNQVTINTEITVYKDNHIKYNESGLTIPNIILDIYDESPPKGIRTQYLVSNSPVLKTEFLN